MVRLRGKSLAGATALSSDFRDRSSFNGPAEYSSFLADYRLESGGSTIPATYCVAATTCRMLAKELARELDGLLASTFFIREQRTRGCNGSVSGRFVGERQVVRAVAWPGDNDTGLGRNAERRGKAGDE